MIKLHNTDCFEVMAKIETGSIDMILTDNRLRIGFELF